MADTKLVSSFRTAGSMGKPASLPPKSPFPSIPPSYGEYHPMGPRGVAKHREGHRHHQRTSSESFLIEEQPSWLDELLDEPDTPVRRGGHRRSSSDSFAYLDPANGFSSFDNIAVEECKGRNLASQSSWGSREFDQVKDVQRSAYFRDVDSFGGPRNRGWEPAFNMAAYPNSLPSPKDSMSHSREFDGLTAKVVEKREYEISAQEPKCLVERREGSYAKHSQSETDSKRVKQQFAQRSRVRKLQYIAELETHVQTLQAERVEVSAELEFLDQQNLILNLENKALKQRLDSLQQEHLIKHLQHEMLEREIARLKSIHQQQQKTPIHGRSSSSSRELDLDMKFANLTLKHKEANSTRI